MQTNIEVSSRQWREQGSQLLNEYYYLFETAKREMRDGGLSSTDPKRPFKLLLLRLEKSLSNTDQNPKKESSKWVTLGKAIIKHFEKHPPKFCESGYEDLNTVRGWLGLEPMIRMIKYRIIVLLPDSFDKRVVDQFATITSRSGKVIIDKAKITNFDEL